MPVPKHEVGWCYALCCAAHAQVTRASPDALVEEKRVSMTCSLNGMIEEVEPAHSLLFNWPAIEMKGRHVADVRAGGVGKGQSARVGSLLDLPVHGARARS